jgi:putative aldouronate transport system permease protein
VVSEPGVTESAPALGARQAATRPPAGGPGRGGTATRRRRGARPWPPPTRGYRVFRVINAILLALVVVAVLFPFLNVLAQSFSSERYINAGQVSLWPRGFNLTTYGHVLSDPLFWNNYRNTVFYTVTATAVAMAVTTCYAYVLSKPHLRGRKVLIGIAVFTMFFNGGIIPNYVLVSFLHMRDTVWAIALPNAINIFNLLVMKSFFENMPQELEEAAAVDGMDTYRILWRIVLPLSKAVIATMTLFYAVMFWNSWFSAFLYMDNQGLFTVTVYLRNVVDSATSVANIQQSAGTQVQIASNIQAVTVVLVAVPILFIYPFIQRYFVSGVTLGAVKG